MIVADLITGPSFYLRTLYREDVTQKYVEFLNDPIVNEYLETRFHEWSTDSVWAYLDSVNQSSDSCLLGIFTLEHLHIGNIKCGPVDSIHHVADLAIFIGDRNYWSKGYATKVIQTFMSYLFTHLPIKKLSAGMYAQNRGSIQAFKKNGFMVEGVLKDHYQLNAHERTDIVKLGLTKDRFIALTQSSKEHQF